MITKYLLAAIALLTLIAASTNAQNKIEIPVNQLDAIYKKSQDVSTQKVSRAQIDKDVEKIGEEMTKKLDMWLNEVKKSEAQLRMDLQSNYHYTPGR
jgi:outer membrane lipoprotein-sorting protein